jgi:hypothetical protein
MGSPRCGGASLWRDGIDPQRAAIGALSLISPADVATAWFWRMQLRWASIEAAHRRRCR